MSDPAAASVDAATTQTPGEGRNTDIKTVLVGMLASAQNAILPAVAIAFGSGSLGILMAFPIIGAIVIIGTLFSYLRWKRLTYTIGETDIRVESGLLSRSARSVPFERIQDVSLEQKLLPRLFGLVSVKFETGAGGGDDLSLAYLTESDGEELRQLVRERRDESDAGSATALSPGGEGIRAAEDADQLFAMGPGRLFTFGLFEFSLAVFAVLFGLLQYAETFVDFELFDPDLWLGFIVDRGDQITAASASAQAIGAILGLAGLFIVGSLTGMVRVFSREWGFLLERTARGFRRRRGLFTRTDVVMPIHRVQGVKIGTRAIRYRFGWHNLSFVSLAQDAGASSHVVAPFARMEEIEPIMEEAGFDLPSPDADWHRATRASMVDGAILDGLFFLFAAAAAWWATSQFAPEWTTLAVIGPLILAALVFAGNLLGWRYRRHMLDARQIAATRGVLSPRMQIATRLKLHSVEIAAGPIARIRGYATVHLGLAGAEFEIPGIPIERAREVRRKILQTIAETDFSQLESQQAR